MRAGWSRTLGYPVLGALLACVLSIGLLLVQAIAHGRAPTLAFIQQELRTLLVVYVYMAVSTLCLLTSLGFLWGVREARLQAGSLTDPLTGLGNRRQLANRLQEELARAARYGTPLAFLLVDLDRLKQLNDRFGHSVGDAALRSVADAIRRSCRRSDVAARFGGDEFAVLAPATSGGDAVALGERIRGAVREMPSAQPLSVSIGVADVSDLSDDTRAHPDELCEVADRALYAAKQRGRDQVVCARELPALLEHSAS